MKRRISSRVLSVASLSLSVAIGAWAWPTQASSTNPTVTVVNTPGNPVPVTGTVTGQVTGTVNASQSGAWNVGITGTPTVQVTGTVKTAPESGRAQTAVQFVLAGLCDTAKYTVPAGNRLVIDFVSASAGSFAGNPDATFALLLSTTLNGSPASQILPMPKQVVDNGGLPFAAFAMAIPVIAYADANTNVCVSTAYLYSGPVSSITVAVTGHLVTQP